jgi:cytochrome c biogenesis protein CcmG/thiol:disulfide interchange protein DsbE
VLRAFLILAQRKQAGAVKRAPLTKLMMSRPTRNSSHAGLIALAVICMLAVSAFVEGNAVSHNPGMNQTSQLQYISATADSQKSSRPGLTTKRATGSEVDFELRDLSGKSIKLSDYRGKVVLVNFWATWCGPCEFEIPVFVKMKRRYQKRGFEVIGISMDDGAVEQIEEFVRQHNINYPVVMPGEAKLDAFGKISSLPTSFLVNRHGRIHSRHQGLLSLNKIEKEVPKLLAQ